MPKYSKRVTQALDICIKSEESGNFYTEISDLAGKMSLPYESGKAIVESMIHADLARWADRQQTVFALNETGRSYKEINHLEAKESFKTFSIGLLSGIITGATGGGIAGIIAGGALGQLQTLIYTLQRLQ